MNAPDVEPKEQDAAAGETESTRIAALETSLRRHRIWLAVLTAILGFFVVSAIALVAFAGLTLRSVSEDPGVSDQLVTETKSAIQMAYGDRLKDVEVRAVKVNYDGAPFPFSVMEGGQGRSLYIQYHLKDSEVTVADLMVDGALAGDVAASGMLPTEGSLTSRMTPEQLGRLHVAYANETDKPLGSVRRYGDTPYPMEIGETVPDEVEVGNKVYMSKDLWAASEGRVVEGDTVSMDSESDMNRSALIFHEDPETGAFTFLGTEPAQSWW